MRPRTTPAHRTAALVAAVALAATACAGGDDATEEGATEGSAGAAGGTVTLVTHDSFNVSEEVVAAFEEETGLTVRLLPSGDAGSMLNQVILTADDPEGDVVFGVDNTLLSRALDAEVFQPYASPELASVPDELVVDERVTPIDTGDVCLNYDVAAFEGREVPETLADLTDPAYAGELVVENPATSSPGLAFLLATVETFGEDGWVGFWEDLVANDVLVVDGWEEAYYGEFSGAGGGEGDRPLVVSYASSPPAEVFFADPQPETAPTGVIVDSCFRQVEYAGLLANAANPEGGRLLIDFLLSETFQADVPLNMFVFPVREGVALPEVFVEHAVVAEDPIEMDPARIEANREDWIDTWTATVLR
ncbi:MAG: thiamine ABC transporter substrate binding subunit [Actinomycetes bacterium]